jgi:phosphatidylglycerol lysyltransferase
MNLRAASAHTFHGHGGPTLVTSERLSQRRQPALHRGIRFERFVTPFLAAITLGSGILTLISVVAGASQPRMLTAFFPLEFSRLSRTLTIVIGFALIISSLNIYKRKKRAWAVVLALSSFSTLFHLTREHNYQEALLSSALLLLLFFTRGMFSVKSRRPDLRSGLLRLLVSSVVAVGYGITGFWLLDERHFGMNFRIGDAIVFTLPFLFLSGDPRLVPHTQYGHWFLDSLYVITLTAGIYSGSALFRPIVYRFRVVPRERAMARKIVQQYARTPLDLFKLWPHKSYFFSRSQRCVISYRMANNTAIALGDPVGPEVEIGTTVREFLEMCCENGWTVGFYQTLPDFLPIYLRLGMKKMKIGDDAMVDLLDFSLQGKSKRELRSKVRQFEAMGIHTREFQPPVPDDIIAQLKDVSGDWLRIPGRRERGFTLGQFDPDYQRSKPVLVVLDSQRTVLAFINLISVDRSELTGDLMRRRSDALNGIMDYLFIKLFLYARERGYARVSLGMAPMTGFGEREQATAEERAIHGLFQQLDFLFSFRGLHHYKAKFATSWEPRYLVYRNVLKLPRTAFALRQLSEIRNENAPSSRIPSPTEFTNSQSRTWMSVAPLDGSPVPICRR